MPDLERMIEAWVTAAEARDRDTILTLLSPEVVIFSPFLNDEVVGVRNVLTVFRAFAEETTDFRYERYWISDSSAVLEFKAMISGSPLHGADIIVANEDGQITRFDILARPVNAVIKLGDAVRSKVSQPSN